MFSKKIIKLPRGLNVFLQQKLITDSISKYLSKLRQTIVLQPIVFLESDRAHN